MGTSSGNLQELTVTCSQCGSASMERLGPREYRCNHCGAITVVSQNQADLVDQAAQSRTATNYTARPVPTYTATTATTTAGTRKSGRSVVTFLAIMATLIILYNYAEDISSSSTSRSKPPVSTSIAGSLLTVSPTVWLSTSTDGVSSGQYTGFITNKSAWPVVVPRYTMTLYVRGVQGATANSEVPVPRLLPGEYEPISFAFETPKDTPRTEISTPDSAARASAPNATVAFSKQQLVRETGKPGYRLVGVITNTGGKAVTSSEVMVMLFGAGHTLLGYGRGYTRTLRAGEQAVVEVPIPTNNVNPVTTYEYLLDATAEDSQ